MPSFSFRSIAMKNDGSGALALSLLFFVFSNTTAQQYCQINGRIAHCTDVLYFPILYNYQKISELNIYCTGRYRKKEQCNQSEVTLPKIKQGWIQKFRRVDTIKIENCPYNEFPPYVFSSLPYLRKLVLFNLSLSIFSDDALYNSYSLESIRLEHVPCMKIGSYPLRGQTRLKEIVLTRTRLSGLVVRRMISSVQTSLAYFSWSKNMLPVTFPIQTFDRFRSLIELDLSYNNLTDAMDFLEKITTRKLILEGNINAFPLGTLDFSRYDRMRNITFLNLRSMKLRHLTSSAFRPLVNLETLLLGKNLLRTISRDLIFDMRQLITLDLSYNRLRSVQQEMEYLLHRKRDGNLFKLDLKGNPLHCNCEIAWLLKFRREAPNDFENLVCNTGINARLNHKKLGDIRLSDLRCKSTMPPVVDIELYGAIKVDTPSSQLYPDIHQGGVLWRTTLLQVSWPKYEKKLYEYRVRFSGIKACYT